MIFGPRLSLPLAAIIQSESPTQRRDCQDRIRTDIPPFSHGDLVIFKEFFESLLLTKRPAVSGIRTRDPLHGSQAL